MKIESSIQCVLKSSLANDKQFYTDDSGITYYFYSLYNDIENCDECSDGHTCDKCQTDYAFKRGDSVECVLKSSLTYNKQFYTNDSGITYYSCSLYNDVAKCIECECSNGNTCEKCLENYNLKNDNKLCVRQADIMFV